VRKIYFVLHGTTRAASAGQNFCSGTTSQLRKDPFHMYTLVPHLPQFQLRAREGWPLLIVATEVNGDRVQMKGVLPRLVRWTCRADSCWYKRFCSALSAVVCPVQNICFLSVHYYNSFVAIAQQAGQPAVLGCLSLSMCLWYQQFL
jgi:hypothetical protein